MTDSPLNSVLERFSQYRLAVIGDVMLDRYIWGQASRISQEAPVPIVQVNRVTKAPGGAANVAANITALGGKACLFGVVGQDEEGEQLGKIMADQGIDVEGVDALEGRRTTVKTRIIGNRQQIVRVDTEETTPLPSGERSKLCQRLAAEIAENKFDGIVFEDYAKGLLTSKFVQQIVDLANQHSVFTILDPHPSHGFKIVGLQAMTPNRAEAFGLTGTYYRDGILPLAKDRPLLEVGAKLMHDWRSQLLLITLGADGMALFTQDGKFEHIPTRAREVFDVSGAGDTVTASFSLAMLAGAQPLQAANLANHAAGLVVAKIGTTPVTADQLREQLRSEEKHA